jgi:hypothetical protein
MESCSPVSDNMCDSRPARTFALLESAQSCALFSPRSAAETGRGALRLLCSPGRAIVGMFSSIDAGTWSFVSVVTG